MMTKDMDVMLRSLPNVVLSETSNIQRRQSK